MHTVSTTPPPPVHAPREAGIEWLRVLACVAIVAFHANTREWPWMIFGLEVFVIFTVALAMGSATRRSIGEFVAARARTLLVVWAVWWVLYAGWKCLFMLRAGKPIFEWFQPWRLLAGPETHLWFLPFAFLVTVGAGLWWRRSHRTSPDTSNATAIVVSLFAACLLVAASAVMHRLEAIELQRGVVYQPWRQWLTVVPAAMLGVALMCSRTREGAPIWSRLFIMWILIVIAASVSWLVGWRSLALPYVIATTLCLAGLSLRKPASKALLGASALTFGIFLVHPAVFDVWYFIAAKVRARDVLGDEPAVAFVLAKIAFTLIVSIAAVWLLRKTPARVVL
jgi:surface polysaccharide O-acyltransferase-like enzyme